jgi:hypothetical protein
MLSVLSNTPSQCKKSEWGEVIRTRETHFNPPHAVILTLACFPIEPFGNPKFAGADTPSNNCSGNEINPLHGSATQAALISRGSFSGPVGI